MSIILNLRDGPLIIPKKYYETYLNIDWFLSGLINFSEDDTYTLWEDKGVVLSLFDTIKFQKLTIHKDVSLDYIEHLADMWCAPQWIIDAIKERKIDVVNEINYPNNDINNHIFKCINCSAGYKIKENTKTACKHHNRLFNHSTNMYYCCSRNIDDEPCVIGYHFVNTYDYLQILNNTENK